jgi:60 kDa SS-A/Ro ribonucleoprotein
MVVNNALDEAFYKAFGNVEDCGKDILIALDISGSMTWPTLMNIPGLDCRVASAAMSMIYLRTQQSCRVMGFSHAFQPINIQDGHRLEHVIETINRMPFGSTDCSLPMRWAKENRNRFQFDAFLVFTDSETNCNKVHPHVALEDYRRVTGRSSALVVNAMAGSRFSIADPLDPRTLDVSGFDSGVPSLVTQMLKQG